MSWFKWAKQQEQSSYQKQLTREIEEADRLQKAWRLSDKKKIPDIALQARAEISKLRVDSTKLRMSHDELLKKLDRENRLQMGRMQELHTKIVELNERLGKQITSMTKSSDEFMGRSAENISKCIAQVQQIKNIWKKIAELQSNQWKLYGRMGSYDDRSQYIQDRIKKIEGGIKADDSKRRFEEVQKKFGRYDKYITRSEQEVDNRMSEHYKKMQTHMKQSQQQTIDRLHMFNKRQIAFEKNVQEDWDDRITEILKNAQSQKKDVSDRIDAFQRQRLNEFETFTKQNQSALENMRKNLQRRLDKNMLELNPQISRFAEDLVSYKRDWDERDEKMRQSLMQTGGQVEQMKRNMILLRQSIQQKGGMGEQIKQELNRKLALQASKFQSQIKLNVDSLANTLSKQQDQITDLVHDRNQIQMQIKESRNAYRYFNLQVQNQRSTMQKLERSYQILRNDAMNGFMTMGDIKKTLNSYQQQFKEFQNQQQSLRNQLAAESRNVLERKNYMERFQRNVELKNDQIRRMETSFKKALQSTNRKVADLVQRTQQLRKIIEEQNEKIRSQAILNNVKLKNHFENFATSNNTTQLQVQRLNDRVTRNYNAVKQAIVGLGNRAAATQYDIDMANPQYRYKIWMGQIQKPVYRFGQGIE